MRVAARDFRVRNCPSPSHDSAGQNISGADRTLIGPNAASLLFVGHGGGWFGVTNRMEFYPNLGYAVVVLSNYDSDPVAIVNKLREWLTQSPSNAVPTPPAFKLTATISPETAAPGEPIKIVVTVKNAGGEAEEKLIDIEVKDASGAKAEQQFTPGQSFDAGETKTYTHTWTPAKPGVYAVDVGVFGDNWATKHAFINGAATITVK